MNMQDKILDAIHKVAKKHKCDFVKNSSYANVGNVYIQPVGKFTNCLSFYYDFQPSNCTLQFYPGDKEVVATCGFTHPNCIMDFYTKYDTPQKIDDMLDWVSKHLGE